MATQIRAELNYLHIAPRKVRLIADLIRGKRVPEAEAILRFAAKHAAVPVAKLLASAVANARHNFEIQNPANLVVSEIRVDQGPAAKRMTPRAMGRGAIIRKKTSHVRLILTATGEVLRAKKHGGAVVAAAAEEAAETPEERRPGSALLAPKVRPKSSRGFAQRMFRRKAI
jgi:large subunit ribosomal protein L22